MNISSTYDTIAIQQKEENRQRWRTLLNLINKVQLILTLISTVFWVGVILVTGQDKLIQPALVTVLILIFTICSSLMLLPKKAGWLEASTAVAIGGLLISMTLAAFVVGVNSGILAALIWAPMLAAVLGLPSLIISVTTVISIGVIVISIFLEASKIVKPTLDLAKELPVATALVWCLCLLMVLAGLLIFKRRLEKVIEDRSEYNKKMELLNEKLKGVATAGSDMSLQVNSMSLELRATSQQQASGSAEQSAAVVAITTSLEEMGQNSRQISENSRQVYEAAAKALDIGREVRRVSEEADSAAQRGHQSVETAIQGFEQVRDGIEMLGQRLLALTTSSNQIGLIIDILGGIADETHLLALNAAIESAGAGESGQRFAVVANEVKSLADRSINSTQEVRQIIAQLQGAVAGAVFAAEETKKETTKAVHKSYETGLVINEVGKVVNITAGYGSNIVDYIELVSRLSEEISLAMQQQQNANSQIINTVQSIKGVAQESAAGSRQVAESAQQLSVMITELREVLAVEQLGHLGKTAV